jgi:hypothetical protein|nr:MAG TPA: BofC-like protein [Caudoviricetes sp.]
MRTTYYSKTTTYGGRYFIMVNDEKRVFTQGHSSSCRGYYQPSQVEVEDLTQKAIKQQAKALLEAGYKELDGKEYYELLNS